MSKYKLVNLNKIKIHFTHKNTKFNNKKNTKRIKTFYIQLMSNNISIIINNNKINKEVILLTLKIHNLNPHLQLAIIIRLFNNKNKGIQTPLNLIKILYGKKLNQR